MSLIATAEYFLPSPEELSHKELFNEKTLFYFSLKPKLFSVVSQDDSTLIYKEYLK